MLEGQTGDFEGEGSQGVDGFTPLDEELGEVLMDSDHVVIYEDHGRDWRHAVSRYLADRGFAILMWSGERLEVVEIGNLDGVKSDRNRGYNFVAVSSRCKYLTPLLAFRRRLEAPQGNGPFVSTMTSSILNK